MAHEDHVAQVELAQHVQDVVRVPLQGAVPHRVVRRQVGGARPDEVERHHRERVLEVRCDVTPHVLVAAEAVHEDDRLRTGRPGDADGVAFGGSHAARLTG